MAKRKAVPFADFRKRLLGGSAPKGAIARLATGEALTAVDDDRVVRFVFSDQSVDRYGDTIDARGWVLDSFAANPVALFGHDADNVDNVIGRARNVRVEGDQLVGDIAFADATVNPRAETVLQMVRGGYLNAVSVGFQPLAWEQTKDKSRPGGIDFKKQELLEISVVPIPANPNAIALAKAAGIDVERAGFVVTPERKIAKKGLYAVSTLASLLQSLGWLQSDVSWEAEYEGDGSEVPGMLAEGLKQLGAALVAMTEEEVGELLAELGGDADPVLLSADADVLKKLSAGQRALIAICRAARPAPAFPSVVIRSRQKLTAEQSASMARTVSNWREGRSGVLVLDPEVELFEVRGAKIKPVVAPAEPVEIRAGKTISQATAKTLRGIHDSISEACTQMRSLYEAPDDESEVDQGEGDAGNTGDAEEKAAAARRRREAEALAAKLKHPAS